MKNQDLERNKSVIVRFDKECVENINDDLLNEFVSEEFVNHVAPEGVNGRESFRHYIKEVLHAGLSDVKLDTYRQIAENDLVVSQKRLTAIHSGNFLGIPATGKKIEMELIEIIRLENGRYIEHWAESNMSKVLASLK